MVLSDISAFTESEIVQLRLGKAGDLRLEQRFKGLLAGGRHGRQRAAVKAAVEGDDLVGAVSVQGAVFARELDGAFVGLRARIGEEHLVEAAVIDQRFCQCEAGAVVERRARGEQQFGLGCERIGNGRRRVAEAIDRPALDEIEVALAAVIPQIRAFAAHEHRRRPGSDFHQCVKRMRGDVHVRTPAVWDDAAGRNARRPHVAGAAFSKTLLIWLFSVVVGHGATHHRRTSDDGKWSGRWSGRGSCCGHTTEGRGLSSGVRIPRRCRADRTRPSVRSSR